MAMEKTGKSKEPQVGTALTPWPNGAKVLVLKGEKGFVPQPTATGQTCACGGDVIVWPDGGKQCQKCLVAITKGVMS